MSTPPFIDAVHAADLLHVSVEQILEWIGAGRLVAFGGRPSNPFVRSSEVEALRAELGVEADLPPRRIKSASARVQQRLTADARWADVSDNDLRAWAVRADPARKEAARRVAEETRERLKELLNVLQET